MDLSKLDSKELSNDGVDLHLRHPGTNELLYANEDKKKPVTIKVLGSDSQAYRNGIRRVANTQMKNKKNTMTAEQAEQENVLLLSQCVKGWKNFVFGDQGDVSFTPAKAFEILDEHPWIREQVVDFRDDRANFLPEA